MPRLIIVPRWAGGPRADFYPWLLDALAELPGRPLVPASAADLPQPGTPRIDTWPPAILRLLLDSPDLEDTFVLGHSVGCQALLRALAELPPGRRVAGMLAVAGWWTVDAPWPTILPWQEPLGDLARVRAALPALTVLLADNDPFTADHATNAALWRERLGARVELVPGARHFNGAAEPSVLAALLRLVEERRAP